MMKGRHSQFIYQFSPSSESFVKTFISKLNYVTNKICDFNVVWNTKKVQSLFSLKDKVNHYSLPFIGEIVLVTKITLERQIVLVTKITSERQFIMLKYDRMNTKAKIANLNQISIEKRTQPINLHEPSSARPLRIFISAEY